MIVRFTSYNLWTLCLLTLKLFGSNSAHIQHYMMKFVSNLPQVGDFLRVQSCNYHWGKQCSCLIWSGKKSKKQEREREKGEDWLTALYFLRKSCICSHIKRIYQINFEISSFWRTGEKLTVRVQTSDLQVVTLCQQKR